MEEAIDKTHDDKGTSADNIKSNHNNSSDNNEDIMNGGFLIQIILNYLRFKL